MSTAVWSPEDLVVAAGKQADGDLDWLASVIVLTQRAHARGDGVAVYVNADLGHPEIGQWQVVTYGGPEAQLETGSGHPSAVLPDIGGRINWRYALEAIVPAAKETS